MQSILASVVIYCDCNSWYYEENDKIQVEEQEG